jgi:hypothetical protein
MSASMQRVFTDIASMFDGASDEKRPTSDYPQWMRRCFMTGKQCIFCPQETVFEDGDGKKRDSAFVIMSFEPHLETFFEWSLRPYLSHFGINKDLIRRADQFANTGYVMCEKICLRIQQAGLIVVDLSVVNPNVYYELGLSVGLNKPILAVCDSKSFGPHTKQMIAAVGLDPKKVLQYPSVGHLDAKRNSLFEHVCKVSLEPRRPAARIVAILVRERPDSTAPVVQQRDIPVTFQQALEAAVGVAVRNLGEKTDARELVSALASLTDEEVTSLSQCLHEYLTTESGSMQVFEKIAPHIDASLISVIDLASENPLSYFWLGYCHARNINVIPIYRQPVGSAERSADRNAAEYDFERREFVDKPRQSGSSAFPEQDGQHVLAFDIRALWYMNHRPRETKKLADKLVAVLEPILVRDVKTQQRRLFWERITRSGRVHIYNGAVHHEELNREVVGDWDLRSASELISYLSSTDESVVPVLQSPIYAPETIAYKLRRELNPHFLSDYIELVRQELAGKNCLILASADVNPITEVVLAYAYQGRIRKDVRLPVCFHGQDQPNDDATVIALKGVPTAAPSAKDDTGIEETQQDALSRRFARSIPIKENEGQKRGFLIDGKPQLLDYSSQDQSEKKFSILAHLVVVKNPFTPDDNVIVLLNGVSGPATFGLAELLTGGAGGTKSEASERLLKTINRVWSEELGREHSRKFNGVEAILRVEVAPPPARALSPNDDPQVSDEKGRSLVFDIERQFFDKRSVVGWDFFSPEEAKEELKMKIGNPRPFPFV